MVAVATKEDTSYCAECGSLLDTTSRRRGTGTERPYRPYTDVDEFAQTDPKGPPKRQRSAGGESLAGQIIAGCRVLELLGTGNMGKVYKAEQIHVGNRIVALKVMLGRLAEHDEFVQRFLQEAEAGSRLDTPYVIGVLSCGTHDDLHYLIMEYADGGTLLEHATVLGVDRPRLPLDEALRLLRECSEGLYAAERAGVVHRDIKPNNILLRRRIKDGREYREVRIADFGAAKILDTAHMLTKESAAPMCPRYASPEQWMHEAVDSRSDMYCLGSTFYHMLVGQYAADGDTEGAIYAFVKAQPYLSPHSADPAVPEELSAIIEKMTARYPKDRFQSFAEVIEAVRAVEEGRVQKIERPPDVPDPVPSSWSRMLPIAAVALLVGALVLGAVHWFAPPPPPPPSPDPDKVWVTEHVEQFPRAEYARRQSAIRTAFDGVKALQPAFAADYTALDESLRRALDAVDAARRSIDVDANAGWGEIRRNLEATLKPGSFDESIARLVDRIAGLRAAADALDEIERQLGGEDTEIAWQDCGAALEGASTADNPQLAQRRQELVDRAAAVALEIDRVEGLVQPIERWEPFAVERRDGRHEPVFGPVLAPLRAALTVRDRKLRARLSAAALAVELAQLESALESAALERWRADVRRMARRAGAVLPVPDPVAPDVPTRPAGWSDDVWQAFLDAGLAGYEVPERIHDLTVIDGLVVGKDRRDGDVPMVLIPSESPGEPPFFVDRELFSFGRFRAVRVPDTTLWDKLYKFTDPRVVDGDLPLHGACPDGAEQVAKEVEKSLPTVAQWDRARRVCFPVGVPAGFTAAELRELVDANARSLAQAYDVRAAGRAGVRGFHDGLYEICVAARREYRVRGLSAFMPDGAYLVGRRADLGRLVATDGGVDQPVASTRQELAFGFRCVLALVRRR
jgi:serine/threonine protein kinase